MKPKNEQLKPLQALILRRELNDLPGELWKDIPGMDGVAMISNLGRVKRMALEITNKLGHSYLLGERMQKIKLQVYYNRSLQEYHHYPTTRVQVSGKSYFIAISRAVYYCFVERFDLADSSVLIISKDHNGLNMAPENLMKVTYNQFQQHIRNHSRRAADFWQHNKMDMPFYTIGHLSKKKQVSQYNMDGYRIATFPSISDAARSLGCGDSTIAYAISGGGLTALGYIWARGSAPTIDVTLVKSALEKRLPKQVTRYNLKGKRINTYASVKEAAKENHVSVSAIRAVIRGDNRTAAGYIWQYGKKSKIVILQIGQT